MPAKKSASSKRKAAKASRKKASKKRTSNRKKTAASKRKVTRKKVAARKPSRKKATSRKKSASKKKSTSRTRASAKRSAKKSPGKKKSTKKKSSAKKKAAKKPSAKKPSAKKKSRSKKSAARKKEPKIPVRTRSTARRRDVLAGPRGVDPYVVKRGEEYMSKGQLKHFEQILSSWKRELMNEVDRTVHHMQDEAANFPDPNDRATQESEFGLELRTRDRERKLLRKINEALARIEEGSYGYCDETGEEIGLKRLEARPVATLCVEAQERRELAERQFRDRDDRYR